jgi:hypothetical protein
MLHVRLSHCIEVHSLVLLRGGRGESEAGKVQVQVQVQVRDGSV